MGVTLSELRRRFYDRMDEGQSQYVSTASANDLLNEAYSLLWGIYTAQDPRFFDAVYPITPTINTRDYALPPSFRRLTKLYALPIPGASPQVSTHVPLERTLRDDYGAVPSVYDYYYFSGQYLPTYEIYGQFIRLSPTPTATPTYTLSAWYTPHQNTLTNDSDSTDDRIFPGHEQFIINQAVILVKIGKEEQPADALMAMHAQIIQQIQTDISQRDIGTGKKVVEIDCNDGWW